MRHRPHVMEYVIKKTSEEEKIDPQYPYALSKNLGEQTALHWHKVYNLPVNSIRIFNAYGRELEQLVLMVQFLEYSLNKN